MNRMHFNPKIHSRLSIIMPGCCRILSGVSISLSYGDPVCSDIAFRCDSDGQYLLTEVKTEPSCESLGLYTGLSDSEVISW